MNRFKKSIITGVLVVSTLFGANTAVASAATHTVTPNETMWIISQKHGVSLMQLIKANPQVANPNYIWSGQVLNIPRTSTSEGTGLADKTSVSAYVSQVVTLVNQERVNAGLEPLAMDNALSAMALEKAKDMHHNRYFSHQSPTYGSPFDMMRSYGIKFTYAGENIAMGQRSPQEVMNAWMNSPGHRQNILSPNFTKIGVAHYNGYWVQAFIAN